MQKSQYHENKNGTSMGVLLLYGTRTNIDSIMQYIMLACMPRPKRKTAIVTLRIEPELKAAAEQAAQYDQRSLTNLIEVLIIERCRALNIRTEPDKRVE